LLYYNSGWTRLAAGGTNTLLGIDADGNLAYRATSTLGLPMGTGIAGQPTVWLTNNTLGATSTLSAAYGGTGISAYSIGSLLVATSTTQLVELGIGQEGRILQVINGRPVWAATSSLGIDINAIGTLMTDAGGTGQDSSGWNGLVHVVNGIWSAIQGTANSIAYWSDQNTLSSTSTIAVSLGGTGAASFTANGILYGNGTGAIQSSDGPTQYGQLLMADASGIPIWRATNTLAINLDDTVGILAVNRGGTGLTLTPKVQYY